MERVTAGDTLEMAETSKDFPLKLNSVCDHVIRVMGKDLNDFD